MGRNISHRAKASSRTLHSALLDTSALRTTVGAIALCSVTGLLTSTAANAQENQTVLEAIVVSATGFEQDVSDAPASITVVTAEQLEKGIYRDLTDALSGVQGVAVTGSPGKEDIFIRGLPGAYTLILVDGKRQSTRDARTNGNSGIEQSFLPPVEAIELIEIVRGPMSSLYGSDAMGGVINIITKKVSDKWTGTVSVDGSLQEHSDYGNSSKGSFYVSGPAILNRLGVQVWGDGMIREEDSTVDGTPELRDVDINGRFTFTPTENQDFMLEAGQTQLRREASYGNTLDTEDSDNYDIHDRKHWSLTNVGRWRWTTSEVSIQQEWAEKTSYDWDSEASDFEEDLRSPEIQNTVVDGKFTTPFSLFRQHTLVNGGQLTKSVLTDQNPGTRTGLDEKFSITQWALFAEDEWWITKNFALTGGLRMDDHEIYGAHFSPRGYAVWKATDQLTLKGGVSTGFKAPDIRTISPSYAYTTGGSSCTYGPTGTCGVIIGSPDIEPEKSTSYEGTILWEPFSEVHLGATYFYTDFRDKIANSLVYNDDGTIARWEEDENYRLYYSYNIDRAVMQGVELTANWQITDDLKMHASYTNTDSEQKTGDYAGLPLARTPKHMANVRFDWLTPIEGLTAWTAGTFHGEEINAGLRLGTAGEAVYNSDGDIVARKYDAYTTIDVGTAYELNEHVTLKAAVYNVFDERPTIDEANTVVDGRLLWAGLTARF